MKAGRTGNAVRARQAVAALGIATLALLPAVAAVAASQPPGGGASPPGATAGTTAGTAAADTMSLARGPASRMSALLEKTFLGVDVLRLDLRLGPETQSKLLPLVRHSAYTAALADSIVGVVLRTPNAWASITFRRHVSLSRFVHGVDDNLRLARKAGLITEANYKTVTDGLPRWFGFLHDSGFARGDRIFYRITAAGLRTTFVDAGGRTRLDQSDEGRDPPLALLAGYLAPGSDFRTLLIRSLF